MVQELAEQAIAIEEHLRYSIDRDRGAERDLNALYEKIFTIRSGGRKAKKKAARLMGAGYVLHVRQELGYE